jgi:hypothetical protein
VTDEDAEILLYKSILAWVREGGSEITPRDHGDAPLQHSDIAFVRFINEYSDSPCARGPNSNLPPAMNNFVKQDCDDGNTGQQSFVLVRCGKVSTRAATVSLAFHMASSQQKQKTLAEFKKRLSEAVLPKELRGSSTGGGGPLKQEMESNPSECCGIPKTADEGPALVFEQHLLVLNRVVTSLMCGDRTKGQAFGRQAKKMHPSQASARGRNGAVSPPHFVRNGPPSYFKYDTGAIAKVAINLMAFERLKEGWIEVHRKEEAVEGRQKRQLVAAYFIKQLSLVAKDTADDDDARVPARTDPNAVCFVQYGLLLERGEKDTHRVYTYLLAEPFTSSIQYLRPNPVGSEPKNSRARGASVGVDTQSTVVPLSGLQLWELLSAHIRTSDQYLNSAVTAFFRVKECCKNNEDKRETRLPKGNQNMSVEVEGCDGLLYCSEKVHSEILTTFTSLKQQETNKRMVQCTRPTKEASLDKIDKDLDVALTVTSKAPLAAEATHSQPATEISSAGGVGTLNSDQLQLEVDISINDLYHSLEYTLSYLSSIEVKFKSGEEPSKTPMYKRDDGQDRGQQCLSEGRYFATIVGENTIAFAFLPTFTELHETNKPVRSTKAVQWESQYSRSYKKLGYKTFRGLWKAGAWNEKSYLNSYGKFAFAGGAFQQILSNPKQWELSTVVEQSCDANPSTATAAYNASGTVTAVNHRCKFPGMDKHIPAVGLVPPSLTVALYICKWRGFTTPATSSDKEQIVRQLFSSYNSQIYSMYSNDFNSFNQQEEPEEEGAVAMDGDQRKYAVSFDDSQGEGIEDEGADRGTAILDGFTVDDPSVIESKVTEFRGLIRRSHFQNFVMDFYNSMRGGRTFEVEDMNTALRYCTEVTTDLDFTSLSCLLMKKERSVGGESGQWPDLFSNALEEWFCPIEGKPGIWCYNGDPQLAEMLSEGKDGFADTQILSLNEYLEDDNEVDAENVDPEGEDSDWLFLDTLYNVEPEGERGTVELDKKAALVATNRNKAAMESPQIPPFFLRLERLSLIKKGEEVNGDSGKQQKVRGAQVLNEDDIIPKLVENLSETELQEDGDQVLLRLVCITLPTEDYLSVTNDKNDGMDFSGPKSAQKRHHALQTLPTLQRRVMRALREKLRGLGSRHVLKLLSERREICAETATTVRRALASLPETLRKRIDVELPFISNQPEYEQMAKEHHYYDSNSARTFFEEFLRTGKISGVDTKASREEAVVQRICEELDEKKKVLIQAVVNKIGAQDAKDLLSKTLEIEEGDGMMTAGSYSTV